MTKQKIDLSPSVLFAVFDGSKKLTAKKLAEVQTFAEYVEKREKEKSQESCKFSKQIDIK